MTLLPISLASLIASYMFHLSRKAGLEILCCRSDWISVCHVCHFPSAKVNCQNILLGLEKRSKSAPFISCIAESEYLNL